MTTQNKTYIADFNCDQWAIYTNELVGQFSDGHWENSNLAKPYNFYEAGWRFWGCIVSSYLVAPSKAQHNVEVSRVPNITNKDLVNLLADRMRFYVAFERMINNINIPELSIIKDKDLMHYFKTIMEYAVVSYAHYDKLSIKFTSLANWNDSYQRELDDIKINPSSSYHQSKIDVFKILSQESVQTILSRIYYELSIYTHESLMSDLKAMKKAMKNIRYVNNNV